MAVTDLEEKFEKSKKLTEFSEKLIAERKAWEEYYAKACEDINKCQEFLKEFRKIVEDYKKVMVVFMEELDNLKQFRELVEMNKQLVEAMKK